MTEARTPTVDPALERRTVMAVSLLAVAAAVLRGIGLNGGLWVDEMYAVNLSVSRSLWQILTTFDGDGQHPLFAVLAHLSSAVLGQSAWSARLPAVLFGVASVPMLYLLGRRVTTRAEALMAATLLTVSYHHVWFSQNARGYSMLAFFAILATYALVRGLREGGWRWFVLYAVAVALGAYTHLTMVFMSVAQFVVVAVWMLAGRERRKGPLWLPVLGGFTLAAALTLLLYAPIIDQVVWWFLYRPSNFAGISTPGWALGEALRVLRTGLGAGPTVLAAGVLLALGTVSWLRRSPVVLALFVAPGLLTLGGALLARGTMYPRFFFYLAGFAVLLAVRGLTLAGAAVARVLVRRDPGARRRLTVRIAAGLTALGVAVSLSSLRYNYRFPKQDFGGALAYLQSSRAADEPVVLVGATDYAYQDWYREPWPVVEDVAQLDAAAGDAAHYWLLYTFPRYIELETPELMARIREDCGERRVFDGTVGDGDVVVCRMKGRET
ncbi:MAG: glycosyltransferase family 39 protein [Gemmatimonadota bacterium]|jgi:4-amino-4-deoxy-L-arabinose transferase-like glycosyltransferase